MQKGMPSVSRNPGLVLLYNVSLTIEVSVNELILLDAHFLQVLYNVMFP